MKYVDDYYGITNKRLKWTSLRVLTIIMYVFGTEFDERKSYDVCLRLTTLGANIVLHPLARQFSMSVDEKKAMKWYEDIVRCLENRKMSSTQAEKLAGRLGFVSLASMMRVGRSFMGAIYAQITHPTRNDATSKWILYTLQWWLRYLEDLPKVMHSARNPTNHIVCWGDASGRDGWLVVVVRFPDGTVEATRVQVGDAVLSTLLHRDNHQINAQELLAICLLVGTWGRQWPTTW